MFDLWVLLGELAAGTGSSMYLRPRALRISDAFSRVSSSAEQEQGPGQWEHGSGSVAPLLPNSQSVSVP